MLSMLVLWHFRNKLKFLIFAVSLLISILKKKKKIIFVEVPNEIQLLIQSFH